MAVRTRRVTGRFSLAVMRTGKQDVEVRSGAGESSSKAMPDRKREPVVRLSPDPAERRASRRGWGLAGSGALVVVLVSVTAAALARGSHEDIVSGSVPAIVQPPAPAPLVLAVDAPASVVAGEIALFVATWSDGSGTVSGSTEDWGDEIGASSRQQETCGPGDVVPPAAGGTYEVSHVWTDPGTYTVALGVATYVCRDGAAVVDEVTETLTVTVLGAEG